MKGMKAPNNRASVDGSKESPTHDPLRSIIYREEGGGGNTTRK
jgi:hypothetical protein